ncbi:MAG TPA: metallophosphoesterase [Terracidiphilus sp.]
MKVWPALGIAIIQVILCLGHWFLFATAVSFWPLGMEARQTLAVALAVLSFVFVASALLSFRFTNLPVRVFYTLACCWMGVLNFLVWAACVCWLIALPIHWLDAGSEALARAWIADLLLALALIASIYGLVNAGRIRERSLMIALPVLHHSWHGRKALMMSDLHLGHINGAGLARRIAAIAKKHDPEIIFIAGDVYDGSKIDPARLAAPLFDIKPPLGIYFCGGNHEEFGDEEAYEAALRAGGVYVLHNEITDVDGVQVAGVRYAETTYPLRLHGILEKMHVDRGRAAILLNHVPNRLPLVEQAGFNLQISGHTHGGQFLPFTWITQRVFGRFTHGLHVFGDLQVLTSVGVGTWGPPMRVGTAPEVILITFEQAS